MYKIFDIAIKDILHSLRSLFFLGMALAVPLLITGLIYFAFGSSLGGNATASLPDFHVVVVNQDRPQQDDWRLGEMLISMLQDEKMPGWLKVSLAGSPAEARTAVEKQQAGAAVLIPPDFSNKLLGDEGATALTIVQDPTLTLGPAFLKDVLTLFVDGVASNKIAMSGLVDALVARGEAIDPAAVQAAGAEFGDWYADLQRNLHHSSDPWLKVVAPAGAAAGNAAGNSQQNLMALIMVGMMIFFVFFAGASSATSILTEDEDGTLARLFTTPTSRAAVLGGKLLAVLATVLVQS
ncbi:MAG: ABC transporter permease, partial [Chloroflexi bacterium]|nr:ABC transporter permease [Chloroflexota bacterium]